MICLLVRFPEGNLEGNSRYQRQPKTLMDLKCYTILEMGDVYKWDKPCGLLKFENYSFLGHPRKGHLAGNIVQKFKFSASFWWN